MEASNPMSGWVFAFYVDEDRIAPNRVLAALSPFGRIPVEQRHEPREVGAPQVRYT